MKTKAQTTTETAVLIACVVAALLAMQPYVKRAIQGRLRQAGDEIGEHYAPANTDATMTTTINSEWTIKQSLVQLEEAGKPKERNGLPVNGLKSEVGIDETTTKTGDETLGRFEDELF